ncbi:hypothetical protein PAECIP112173_00950 [Paenibacillus sp. JJ-100]|uniref:hypothetical protein n=1 Tax=Paenibacillus sp. JJ-100 TaxID=2974896 RepID=UPI0022FFC1D2|nr:hypothetical protein [Paenibacillus sp. JJ-100]CAI6039404.1 hypothetical protein PAECIP112173_00950 [Paenibacillus sp. JJ-100]
MSGKYTNVPFGYEPPVPSRKGTLIFYDSFEHVTDEQLERAASMMDARGFKQLVLYPLHESTVRRMSRDAVQSYYKREDRLHAWRRDHASSTVRVEGLEGKRKKYTPIDTALRHIQAEYPAPLFLYMTSEMANLFASFDSFTDWIKELRLIIDGHSVDMHPRLEQFQHRWEMAENGV